MTVRRSKNKSIVKRRPAESASVGLAGTVVLILALFDVDVTEISVAAIVTGVGAAAAVVTAIVDRVRGRDDF